MIHFSNIWGDFFKCRSLIDVWFEFGCVTEPPIERLQRALLDHQLRRSGLEQQQLAHRRISRFFFSLFKKSFLSNLIHFWRTWFRIREHGFRETSGNPTMFYSWKDVGTVRRGGRSLGLNVHLLILGANIVFVGYFGFGSTGEMVDNLCRSPTNYKD